ncbi:MAG: bifunctional riboflavin kinase/FAD synthetase [Lachnospiraceae bacterium]|nr:bifunctional riboflavin kinase/FAD synthetase [Lachnospiraceae bacterium]
MKIIQTKQFYIEEPTAVAMGKFDSLHLGHKVILDRMKREAECSLRTVVVSFEPGPEVFFGKYKGGFVLTDEEKQSILEKMGIDYYVLFPFDAETAGTDAEVFLKEVLLKQMNMQVLVAGDDLSFGKNGTGNVEFIKEKSMELDFKFCACPKLHINAEEVSATLVRENVVSGNMEKCYELLGRNYRVEGTVCKGNQLGRTFGVPTCNIITPKEKLLPPNGVYFTRVTLQGETYYGVTNVGTKPTVSGDDIVGIETYIIAFEREVYGERLSLDFIHFHRTEHKFKSLEHLKMQLGNDITMAKEYFNF